VADILSHLVTEVGKFDQNRIRSSHHTPQREQLFDSIRPSDLLALKHRHSYSSMNSSERENVCAATIVMIEHGIDHRRHEIQRRRIILGHNKRLNTRISATLWFDDCHCRKENFELRVEKTRVFASKDFGHKRPANTKQMRCDI
jgi:hypothetical protein